MEGVTYLCTLAPLISISTHSFYVLLKNTQKKLQKETSIDAHILMLVPLLLLSSET